MAILTRIVQIQAESAELFGLKNTFAVMYVGDFKNAIPQKYFYNSHEL